MAEVHNVLVLNNSFDLFNLNTKTRTMNYLSPLKYAMFFSDHFPQLFVKTAVYCSLLVL